MAGGFDGPVPVPARAEPSGNLFAMFGILPVFHCTPPAPSLLGIEDHALPSIISQPAGGRTDASARYHMMIMPMGRMAGSSLPIVIWPSTTFAVMTELSCSSELP